MCINDNIVVVNGFVKCVITNFNNFSFSHEVKQTIFKTIIHDYQWDYPSDVINIIIQNDFKKIDIKDLLISYLNVLNNEYLLIISDSIKYEDLICLIDNFPKSTLSSVTFLLSYKKEFESNTFIEKLLSNRFVEDVIFYNAPILRNIENKISFFESSVSLVTVKMEKNKFFPNKILFTESQAHHTYFNRKLYIGPNGEIKNAPECEETFGYIQDLESPEQLKEIVQTPEFQKYWYVHKEITDVCKDCEFRHMCVDNRLPYQRSENEWYQLTECNYNPYIAKWKDEEGYRTLAECGVISNENGFSIDYDKIAMINEELWGEE